MALGTNATTDYIAATLDEVAVYPRALSAAQANNHYKIGTGHIANSVPVASFTT